MTRNEYIIKALKEYEENHWQTLTDSENLELNNLIVEFEED
jgi:hypothetical protein